MLSLCKAKCGLYLATESSGGLDLNRLLAVLFIPLLVVGNSFPHTHAGVDTVSNHAERPHVHVAASLHAHGEPHHHAGQDDAETDQGEQPTHERPSDHDSDAIYLSGGQFFLPTSADSIAELQLDCVGFVASDCRPSCTDCQTDLVGHEVPIRTGPPLFLLHAALRL